MIGPPKAAPALGLVAALVLVGRDASLTTAPAERLPPTERAATAVAAAAATVVAPEVGVVAGVVAAEDGAESVIIIVVVVASAESTLFGRFFRRTGDGSSDSCFRFQDG